MDAETFIVGLLGVIAALLTGIISGIVAVRRLRPDIEGIEAVTERERSTAEQNRAEASKIFTEAAATLIVPMQSEVTALRERIVKLEAALELERLQHQETRKAQEIRDSILFTELARRGIQVQEILEQRRRDNT